MDTFHLVTETAMYRRRYVVKNLPDSIKDSETPLLCSLVGSATSIELPEGYILEGKISDIKYSRFPIDLNDMDGVTRQCVSNLVPLDEPIIVKKVKKPFINDGSLNKDKQYRNEPSVISEMVQPKKKRAKTIDWEAIASENQG